MEQLEFKFDKREFLEDKLRREYAEFKSIEKVWDAFRFAKEYEPEKGWRERNLFYIPGKGRSWEVKKLLTNMFPKSRLDIRKMNQKQAYRVYIDIMYFVAKVN
ncbi:MAG: hypothetical protein KKB39_02395 [Nanoarchaeota archaeon]|nr:hypothetical protein [Nanoarchaeota archaeon]